MDITLRIPLSFSEIGKKENQEDRLYPSSGASPSTRTFILCDGMGGHARGEVAAEVVSVTLGGKLDEDHSADVSVAKFETALSGCYKALDEKLPGDDNRRPGTTLTCLRIGSNGVLAAHIGDSRIYQVRPGAGIMFRTEDHSLVNELVRAGQITEAEARVHPRRNVITRAMMPGTSNPPKADVAILTDVRAGDFFFICCDGVLEKLQEDRLIKILSNSATTDEAKLSAIKAICDTGTRDNYTAWLIPVADVAGNDTPEGRPVITLEHATDAKSRPTAAKAPAKETGKRVIAYGIGILILCAIAAVLMITLRDSGEDKTVADAPIIENEKTTEDQAVTSKPQDDTERQRDAVRRTRDKRPEAPKPETSATEDGNAPKENIPASPDAKQGAAANAAAAAASKRRKDEPTPVPTPEEPEKKPEPAKTDPEPASDPDKPITE